MPAADVLRILNEGMFPISKRELSEMVREGFFQYHASDPTEGFDPQVIEIAKDILALRASGMSFHSIRILFALRTTLLKRVIAKASSSEDAKKFRADMEAAGLTFDFVLEVMSGKRSRDGLTAEQRMFLDRWNELLQVMTGGKELQSLTSLIYDAEGALLRRKTHFDLCIHRVQAFRANVAAAFQKKEEHS
jgi:hypothetical protein